MEEVVKAAWPAVGSGRPGPAPRPTETALTSHHPPRGDGVPAGPGRSHDLPIVQRSMLPKDSAGRGLASEMQRDTPQGGCVRLDGRTMIGFAFVLKTLLVCSWWNWRHFSYGN